MNIEIVGKFYDNHSLSLVNRNLAIKLKEKNIQVKITALDKYNPEYRLDKKIVNTLKKLEQTVLDTTDIQVRHTYPPIWNWPEEENTKIVYIQPWEFSKVPFEWQYKFETFADALIVPSNFCASVFRKGGLNPTKLFVVPNGYDTSLFNKEKNNISVTHLGIDQEAFNFVYVGNAQWRKGLDILLSAWQKSFKRYDKAKLIIKDNSKIYGLNNTLNESIKLQYKTECAEIIYIDKDLSDKEMSDIFKASRVVVHPYRAEGFAMHVQEAVACGCLPIVSSNGPTEDFLGSEDVGIKLPVRSIPINIQNPDIFALKPGDATTMMSTHTFINEPTHEDLAKAMSYVYNSHNKKNMYENLSKAELNTWGSVADKYIDIFTEIKDRQPKRRN